MKVGAENRNKTILLGVLGTCALVGVGVTLFRSLGDSTPAPPPAIAPVAKTIGANNAALAESERTPESALAANAGSRPAAMPTGNAVGVAAKKVATSPVSLDPTLNQSAMLRTEHLVYSGVGRNIFSAVYVPTGPTATIPRNQSPPRPPLPATPLVPQTPVYVPPPINLKFFGTATQANGTRQAFLLQGDDVFLASQGDIVARRYRIVSISANSIQVEDMGNNNTQTLPLQLN